MRIREVSRFEDLNSKGSLSHVSCTPCGHVLASGNRSREVTALKFTSDSCPTAIPAAADGGYGSSPLSWCRLHFQLRTRSQQYALTHQPHLPSRPRPFTPLLQQQCYCSQHADPPWQWLAACSALTQQWPANTLPQPSVLCRPPAESPAQVSFEPKWWVVESLSLYQLTWGLRLRGLCNFGGEFNSSLHLAADNKSISL